MKKILGLLFSVLLLSSTCFANNLHRPEDINWILISSKEYPSQTWVDITTLKFDTKVNDKGHRKHRTVQAWFIELNYICQIKTHVLRQFDLDCREYRNIKGTEYTENYVLREIDKNKKECWPIPKIRYYDYVLMHLTVMHNLHKKYEDSYKKYLTACMIDSEDFRVGDNRFKKGE